MSMNADIKAAAMPAPTRAIGALQVGGSISFAPEPGEDPKWQGYDTRHMLAEIDPKPG